MSEKIQSSPHIPEKDASKPGHEIRSDFYHPALGRKALVCETQSSSFERRPKRWQNVSYELWQSAEWQWQHRLSKPDDFIDVLDLFEDEISAIQEATSSFSLVLSPHYAALIRPELGHDCPIRRQAIPQMLEFGENANLGLLDPLGEEAHGILPGLIQRYPDRVLLYCCSDCAVRCRHCTRRRKVGIEPSPSMKHIDAAIDYISTQSQIRDVLISGGDPLCLSNDSLVRIISKIRKIPHIDVIRLCTRMPVTLPQRIDDELCKILRNFSPIYVQTQFNHCFEVCEESEEALKRIRESGCVIHNQSVLLRGINDSSDEIERLNRRLLRSACKPYYLFALDVAHGTSHFKVPLKKGLEIMQSLRGNISGLGIPQFVLDLPGGGGKVSLLPDARISGEFGTTLEFQNWYGDRVKYEDF